MRPISSMEDDTRRFSLIFLLSEWLAYADA
jgi:hypothetical protein